MFEVEAPFLGNEARTGGIAKKVIMQERWLSVDEIAAHLGVNPDTIYKWITRKSMPAHKAGKLWKFMASEVDEWVKGGKAAQKANNKRVTLKNPKRPETGKHPQL